MIYHGRIPLKKKQKKQIKKKTPKKVGFIKHKVASFQWFLVPKPFPNFLPTRNHNEKTEIRDAKVNPLGSRGVCQEVLTRRSGAKKPSKQREATFG